VVVFALSVTGRVFVSVDDGGLDVVVGVAVLISCIASPEVYIVTDRPCCRKKKSSLTAICADIIRQSAADEQHCGMKNLVARD
jgi:hypothetical protein